MKKILFLAALLCTAIAFTACKSGGEDTEAPNVSGVTLNKTTLTVAVGDGEILQYTVTPAEAEDQSVTWSSSDPTVATVDERGMVEGVKAGTAVITVTTTDGGKTATCTVTVVAEIVEVTGITLAPTTAKVEISKTTTLVATVMPENASDKTVTWATSDATVATVAGGVVTGVKAGTATITATASNGDEATCAVTVEAAAPLASEYTTAVEASQGIAPSTGDGTEANPYLLASAENLRWMKMQNGENGEATKNKYYKLTTDINVTADKWIAIKKFQGHFDGDNHKVTGKLTPAADLTINFGFIGTTRGGSASIKNFKMEAEISAANAKYVGAVLGSATDLQEDNMSFVITNCTNSGKITGKTLVGGIAGGMRLQDNELTSLEHTLLDNCVNTGEIVSLEGDTGGIVGEIYFGLKYGIDSSAVKITVKNCSNSGNVSGQEQRIGGIVGKGAMYASTLIVKGCVNTGVIKSGETQATANIGDKDNKYLGLIVGDNFYSNGDVSIE